MKKFLGLLVLILVLACSMGDETFTKFNATGGETMADGLKWYDVIVPLSVGSEGGWIGSDIMVDPRQITPDVPYDVPSRGSLAFIEYSDVDNYVGADRNRIVDGKQQYVEDYNFLLYANKYAIKVVKGDDLTQERFDEALADGDYDGDLDYIYYNSGDNLILSFYFSSIDENETIPIGAELAKLEVYNNKECTGDPLEVFSLRL